MKKTFSFIKQPDLARLALWRSTPRSLWSSQPGSARARKSLVTGLSVLLLLLLVFTWIVLTRQWHAPSGAALATSPAPTQIEPPRRDSALVYDPLQHVVLLFGGTLFTTSNALTNETWTWNGSAWQRQHPEISPPALQGRMVYDATSQQVILFLNQTLSGGTIANEMWTWDDHNWHQFQPVLMPEVTNANLAYDAANGQVLLFGNEAQNGVLTSATWTWNGSAWLERHPPTSPAPRTAAALAYDNALQQIVLYGGVTTSGVSSETWTWNGSAWLAMPTSSLPSPRQNGLLVYDSASQQLLLFGGLSADGTRPALSDTWSLQNKNWIRVSATGAPTDLYASAAYDDSTRTVLVYAVQGTIPKDLSSNSPPPVSQTWTWNGSTWRLLK